MDDSGGWCRVSLLSIWLKAFVIVVMGVFVSKEKRPFIFAMILFSIGLAIFFGVNEWMTRES